ncbi:MAG: hypothetical protein ACTSU5_17730 [Promethearchaeota archaeon]
MTERRENWSVFVIPCPPKKWPYFLVPLFDLLGSFPEAEIPHFEFFSQEASSGMFGTHTGVLSLRVLREPAHQRKVEDKVLLHLGGSEISCEVSRNAKTKLDGWIDQEKPDKSKSREYCEVLNKLSEFVVFMVRMNQFAYETRFEMCHRLVNMVGAEEVLYLEGGSIMPGIRDLQNNKEVVGFRTDVRKIR